MISDLTRLHKKTFNMTPEVIVRAPGRVNLIGDHTDYNDGFVMPIAIDRYIWVAVSRRNDQYLKMYSIDHNEIKRCGVQNLRYKREDKWANYVKGVVSIFRNRGYDIGGLNISITGNIPEGAGLSSSAALEVGVALALSSLYKYDIDKKELALITMEAENSFIGVKCGIMDQFVSLLGQEGHAMFLDTRTLNYELIPVNFENLNIVITNSNVPRGLVDSEYNERRKDCEKCIELLKSKKRGTKLRDYTVSDLQELMGVIPESTRKKCLHVIEENQRVIEAKYAIKKNDPETFGRLMNRSHESLRDLFEVSCPELDWLVKRAWETEGVIGSRMTGAGFGGCTVTLMDKRVVKQYEKAILQFEKIFGFHPDMFIAVPSNGAEVL